MSCEHGGWNRWAGIAEMNMQREPRTAREPAALSGPPYIVERVSFCRSEAKSPRVLRFCRNLNHDRSPIYFKGGHGRMEPQIEAEF